MSLGSVPDGRTTTRAPPSCQSEAQAVGGRQAAVSSGQVVDALDPASPELDGGSDTQVPHGRGDLVEVVDADRQLVGGVQPVLDRDVVEQVEQAAALGLERGCELGDKQSRAHAVLVGDRLRVDAVAEGLLVAEGEPGHPADPLEAGQRLDVRQLVRSRRSRDSRDDDTIEQASTLRST